MRMKSKLDESYDEKVDRIAKALVAVVVDNAIARPSASVAALRRVLDHALGVQAIFEKHDTGPIVWH
jgi:hypothetical protein